MRKVLLLTLTLGLALAGDIRVLAGDDAGDWPQWRGPRRDAVSTEKNLLKEWPAGGPPLVWNSAQVNDGKNGGLGATWSSVVVAGGRLFTMGCKDRQCFVSCLEEATGKRVWETRIDAGADHPHSTPTVDGDKVYALSLSGQLVCLDTAKGSVVWKKDLEKEFKGKRALFAGYSESPLIDGDKIVCCPGADQATMVALKKLTGETIWTASIQGAGEASHSSIVIAEVGGIRQYVTLAGSKAVGLVGVSAATGKLLWSYHGAAGGSAQIPTPIVKGDRVFTVTGYSGGSSLLQLVPDGDGIKVKELYHLPGTILENLQGGFVLVGDKIYGGHGQSDGQPFCLDMPSGKFDWKPVRGAGKGSAGVVYADGHLYFRYEDNIMALIEATPAGYKLKSKFQMPGDLDTGFPHPVIAHGRLYIRVKDAVLCYDLRQK
jgi:outer membrane protein assembly factor BamB